VDENSIFPGSFELTGLNTRLDWNWRDRHSTDGRDARDHSDQCAVTRAYL